jgi:hypothetical protein
MTMQAPSPNVMPQTHLSAVLNYLKQGHPVLPSQYMQPIEPNFNSKGQVGHFPMTNPTGA